MSPLDPRRRDLVKCEDMRIHSERARQFLGSRSFEEFLSDELVQDAVIRCVEVVGEAARQVSDTTREQTSDMPWALVIGMRNILAHDYGGVDLEQVYRVVMENIPELLTHLGGLIARLEREAGWRGENDPRE
jgi:uncharacterized protein with HEPN domain